MSWDALNWVKGMYPVYQGRPDTLAKHMLLFAAVRSDTRGESYWGEENFRRELCAGRDAFRARKAFLVEAGYVVIERRRHTQGPRRGQRTSDLWKLQLATRLPDEPPHADQPDAFWAGPQADVRADEPGVDGAVERTGPTPEYPEPTKPRTTRSRPNSGPAVEEEQVPQKNQRRRTSVTSGDPCRTGHGPAGDQAGTTPARLAGRTSPDEPSTRPRRRPARRTRPDDDRPAVEGQSGGRRRERR